MTQEFPMVEKEHTTEKEWLEDIFYRSNSHSSQKNAIVAMRTFDIFCKEKLELPDPEVSYLVANYDNTAYENRITVMELIKDCLLFSGHKVDIEKMKKSLKSLGYVIKDNTITNIKKRE